MRKAAFTLTTLAAACMVSGCSALGGNRAPDEFAVTRSAPLIVPPNFNLAPPVAGTAGLTAGDAQQQAIDTLFGGPSPRSNSETSLLESAGRDMAQLGIRTTVRDPDTRVVDKGPATLTILSSQPANSTIASAQAGQ